MAFAAPFVLPKFALSQITAISDLPLSAPVAAVDTTAFKLGHRPELDGLRGISILLVLLLHLRFSFVPGGFIGVDIFFVLSGFLITSLLIQEWDRRGSISLKAFYIRRALRLMPALGLFLVATGTFALFCLPKEKAAEVYQGILLTLSYVSNWVFALNPRVKIGALGITWSLAIEEQFYLVWPLLLTLALKLKVRRGTIIFTLLFAVVAVLLHRRLLFEEGAIIRRLYYATDTRADGLLVGCIVGLLLSANMIPRGRYFRSVMFALALVAAAFIVYFVATSSMGDAVLYDGLFTVVAVAIGLLLTVLLLWPPAAIMALLRFPPLRWIGRISYGLYLWHWPIQQFLGDENSFSWPKTIGILVIVFAVTSLSFYCIEKPVLRLKGKFASA